MPLITDIRPQKKHRTGEPRFNIYLDGQFYFALSAEALVKSGLKTDQILSQEQIEKLIKKNEFIKVYDLVLRFLSFRPRSEKELQDWFKKKEVGEETQKMVRGKLEHLGYINDEEFAKWWIEQRTNFRPMGKRAIEMELRQKGIPESLITNYKLQITNEFSLAKKAAEKKVKLWQKLPSIQFRQKITAFLFRRGFSWETIEQMIDELSEKE